MKFRIILIIFILYPVLASAVPEKNIKWDPVPGAWKYYLEIKNSSGNIVVKIETVRTYYPVSGLEPGAYSFRIATVNVLRQRGESTPWIDFVLEKLVLPELKSLSQRELISAYNNKGITVKGKNFKPGLRLVLRGNGKELVIENIDLKSEDEAVFSYRPDSSSKGVYDLVAVNRGGAEALLKNAVEIVAVEAAEVIFFAGAGYTVNFPMGRWKEYYEPSYAGGEVYLQFSGRNLGLFNTLFELSAEAFRFSSVDKLKRGTLTAASSGIGAGYYFPVIKDTLELYLKIQGGGVYSVLKLDDNLIEKSFTSADPYAMAAAGIRIFPFNCFFIDAGGGWKTVFYTGGMYHDVRAAAGCGFRF